MKSRSEIEDRLLKLKTRHRREYIQNYISKIPDNCTFNLLVTPKKLEYKESEDILTAPKKSRSLVIFHDNDRSIRVCTHDSNGNWNGDICDDESVSKSCPKFKSKNDIPSLENEFEELLKDDKLTIKNYPDIAAFQWTLGIRLYDFRPSLWLSIKICVRNIIGRIFKGEK